MQARGLFFLRMHASVQCDAQGQRVGVLLPVIERDPQDHRVVLNQLLVAWPGDAALAFFDAHQAQMRAGCPLQLEVDRLRGDDGQWRARAVDCELAPVAPSWRAHQSTTQGARA
jgi:hypothetical protein